MAPNPLLRMSPERRQQNVGALSDLKNGGSGAFAPKSLFGSVGRLHCSSAHLTANSIGPFFIFFLLFSPHAPAPSLSTRSFTCTFLGVDECGKKTVSLIETRSPECDNSFNDQSRRHYRFFPSSSLIWFRDKVPPAVQLWIHFQLISCCCWFVLLCFVLRFVFFCIIDSSDTVPRSHSIKILNAARLDQPANNDD